MTSTDTAGQVEARARLLKCIQHPDRRIGSDHEVARGVVYLNRPSLFWEDIRACLFADADELAARQSPAPATQAAGGGVVEAEIASQKWEEVSDFIDRGVLRAAINVAQDACPQLAEELTDFQIALLATLSPASKVQTAGDEGVGEVTELRGPFRAGNRRADGQFYVWDESRSSICNPDTGGFETPYRRLITAEEVGEAARLLNERVAHQARAALQGKTQ